MVSRDRGLSMLISKFPSFLKVERLGAIDRVVQINLVRYLRQSCPRPQNSNYWSEVLNNNSHGPAAASAPSKLVCIGIGDSTFPPNSYRRTGNDATPSQLIHLMNPEELEPAADAKIKRYQCVLVFLKYNHMTSMPYLAPNQSLEKKSIRSFLLVTEVLCS